MHTLNTRVIVAQLIEERVDSASRARRFGRARRFTRGERRRAPSSPIPGRPRMSGAGR